MAPRGRPRRRSQPSESGASVADTEPDTDGLSASASRPRRSRQPKRYFDDDYSPPPSKKRAPAKGRCSESGGEEEQEEKAINHKVPVHTPKMEKAAEKKQQASKSTPKPRGRPKKAPTPTGRRKSKKQEEEVVYMDEDSEDQESSDEEYEMPPEEEEIEEELELSDYKVEKLEEEDSYCPWLDADPDTLPKLDLPESSQDIPLPNHATFDAIEVYEILRSYHRTLRITPFTFEDFCAALISYNNSCIIAEVHIALLRICLKSDEEEQTHYSVTETNNAVNIMIHHLETMTYAEILRQYIEAYPYADDSVRAAINAENYPYVGYEPKLVVLLFMCYRFLYSSEYKKVVTNVGRFQNDDNCRVCGKSSGRIVGCSQCEASFHVECSRLNPFPEVLVCNICTSNSNVRGVSNAIPFGESIDREPLRSQPIGRDRYGRYYWFVCRRLVVQSLDESEIHYYSTPPQLYQLVQRFDRTYYEKDLCEVIKSRIDEFLEQMTLTVEMTNERRDAAVEAAMKKNGMPYEYVEPATPQIYLQKDSTKRMASILRDCAEKAQVKQEVKDEPDSDDEATRSSGPLEIRPGVENDVLPESMIGIYDGRLINTFWSGGSTQEELVAYYLQKPDEPIDPAAFWRMGDETNDQTFMSYYNYYSRNEMAESSTSRKKQADKKKYMSSRFAILDNFEWVVAKDRQFYGNSVLHTKFVSWTLSKISRKIPADLMHRRWLEVAKQFDEELNDADDYHKLVMCLLKLDAVIRKTVFVQQWWSGLGQTKLERRTVEQRETFMKEQQKNKKAELDALAKDLDESFVRVNYMKPKWPNTYILRQKGESYRNAGRGGMGGWAWVANKYIERKVPVPEKPVLPLASEGSEDQKTESAANRKARNLESLIAKMKKVRREKEAKAEEPSVPNFLLINRCYTPTCAGLSDQTFNPQCYSPSCRYGHLSMVRQKYEEEETAKKGKLGEEKAWPIPDIQTFTTKHGKSLFVLPKRILRQMIVTGGCQSVYMPGFVPTAKSNQLVWSYPAPRPTLDLCWKWATLNAKSLHAVALQLKIMWSSIKWSEFEPDDQHPDRRVVIDTPSHDERRRIISHKEMPPYGQYERYQLEIEIIPLHEENDGDEEESWTSRRGTGDCAQRVSARKKRPGLRGVDRRATSIRKEWVDGVTLKVFEIKDYWKSVRQDADRAAKKRVEAMRKAQKAREDAERQRQQALVARQQKALAPPTPNIIGSSASTRRTTLDRVPYVPVRNRDLLSNGRYLEKYNSSQISPRTIVTGVPGVPQPIVRVTPSPIVRKTPSGSAYTQYGSETRHYHPYPQQNPSTSRAAAGADGPTTTYRAVVMQGNTTAQPAMRVTANGYQFPENVMRGGGRVNPSLHGFPRRPSQPAVVLKPFGEPINDMRRVAEEAVSANAGGSDGDEQPPVIPRYDRNSVEMQQQQQMQQQAPRPAPIRQIVNIGGTQMRAIPMGGGAPGSKGLVVVRQPDGSQKIVMRAAGPSQAASSSGMVMEQTQPMYRQDYPPGTVLAAPPRVVTVRGSQSMQQQPSQQFRALYSGGNAPRYVRISGSGNAPQLRQSETVVRRIVPNSRPMEYSEDKGAPQQPQRFVLQGSQVPPKMPRVAPRGGMTMQMVQQQHPAEYEQAPLDDNHMVVVEEAMNTSDATGLAVSANEQEEQ